MLNPCHLLQRLCPPLTFVHVLPDSAKPLGHAVQVQVLVVKVPQLATLHALQVFLSALSWKPAAQVMQPSQVLAAMRAQLVTVGHCGLGGWGRGTGTRDAGQGKRNGKLHLLHDGGRPLLNQTK